MFEPISDICALMLFFDPWPMASMVMTDATPIIMPNMVRKHLILLLLRAFNAIFRRFPKFMSYSFSIGNASSTSFADDGDGLTVSDTTFPSRSTMFRDE